MKIPFARLPLPLDAEPAPRRHAWARQVALAWLLAAAPVAAQMAPLLVPQVAPETVTRALALAAEAAKALAPREARIEVEPGRLDPRLTLAPCTRVEPYLPSGVPAWGRTRVGLRCAAGATRWNVFLPVSVQVWAPALVATAALPAGARLTEGQLSRAEVDWAASSTPPLDSTALLEGRTLARAVAAGQALRSTDLQPRQWFALGDSVRIEATGAGFSIVAEGKALASGLEGQSVRVRVVSERAEIAPVLLGRPVGDHRVEVHL